ncbi:MAG: shikimate kinase [Candidatus Peregrinibacteria bacterium]
MVQKIVLIGLRGSGKSHFGSLIAQDFGWNHIDLDKQIEMNEGKKISEIIAEKGWDYFREKEYEACKAVENAQNLVISTGGGAICFERNVPFLKKNAFTVLLFSQLEDLVERLERSKDRPPLTRAATLTEEVKMMWAERKDTYFKEADLVFKAQKVLPHAVRNVEYNATILANRIKKEIHFVS